MICYPSCFATFTVVVGTSVVFENDLFAVDFCVPVYVVITDLDFFLVPTMVNFLSISITINQKRASLTKVNDNSCYDIFGANGIPGLIVELNNVELNSVELNIVEQLGFFKSRDPGFFVKMFRNYKCNFSCCM